MSQNQNAVAATQPKPTGLKLFNQKLTDIRTQDYLKSVLGEKKDSFVNNITALVANNAMLQECAPMTVIYAAIKATALNLPLDQSLGFAYVIPYENNKKVTDEHGNPAWVKVKEAQFQIGYKGFIQLAMRSGQFKTINVRDVRLGEVKGEDFVSGEMIFSPHKPEERDQFEIVGYVGFFELTNGFRKMAYWTIQELEQHGLKYSKTYANERTKSKSLWATDFDTMAKKTVLKLLLSKYAPLSVEMEKPDQLREGIKADQASFSADGDLIKVSYNDRAEDIDTQEPEVIEESDDVVGKAMAAAK